MKSSKAQALGAVRRLALMLHVAPWCPQALREQADALVLAIEEFVSKEEKGNA